MEKLDPLTQKIWEAKYRYHDGGAELTIDDSWRRISRALAKNERERHWEERFYSILRDFSFLPGGRILAGAGTKRKVTLFNCFVMGHIEDSMSGIFEALKEGALTMQEGGGVGYDFSTIRPAGAQATACGAIASGPVSFMKIWDSMCATILSTGARRGAMMGVLRADHPDIEQFVAAKKDGKMLRHFNLSVLAGDDFMQAVNNDRQWPLLFPDSEGTVARKWPGSSEARPCKVYKIISARQLWADIMKSAYDSAEPGVIFIDRVRHSDNLRYAEEICATNPCGEIPLPPYGACDLGSINLTRFITHPFQEGAQPDFAAIFETAAIATRMLDNVYDISHYPLPKQQESALNSRRIGLGFTGLADAFIMLGLPYDSSKALLVAEKIMQTICHAAYRTSIALAREKGAFPLFRRDEYCAGTFVQNLPQDIRGQIFDYGIRNSHLNAIAPAGTISLLAGNVSSGIEPVYRAQFQRKIRNASGSLQTLSVKDYAVERFQLEFGENSSLPPAFQSVEDVSPQAQIRMQAALQPFVDNAISKTVNVSPACDFADFSAIYLRAHALGLKGCTVFRPNAVSGQVLVASDTDCCAGDRQTPP